MIDLRTGLLVAGGQAPTVELVAARRILTRRQLRAARRAVREGEVAADPAAARWVVAQARQTIRRGQSRSAQLMFATIVLFSAGFFVAQVVRGDVRADGVIFGALAVPGAWIAVRLPHQYSNALQAERLNREILEQAGQPYQGDLSAATLVELAPVALAAGVIALWGL